MRFKEGGGGGAKQKNRRLQIAQGCGPKGGADQRWVSPGEMVVACWAAGTSPSLRKRRAFPGFLIMGATESPALILSPIDPERSINIFGSMPARVLLDADGRRLAAEANPRSFAPVDSLACTHWFGWRLMPSLGHPSEKVGLSSAPTK